MEMDSNYQSESSILLSSNELSGTSAKVEPAANITLTNNGQSILATQNTEVTVPKEYLDDTFVAIRKSDLDKARSLLSEAANTASSAKPVGEIALALATTLLGVFLTSIFSSTPIDSPQGIFSYCLCPVFAVASFAVFLWRRHEASSKMDSLTERVLDHLVDPSSEED